MLLTVFGGAMRFLLLAAFVASLSGFQPDPRSVRASVADAPGPNFWVKLTYQLPGVPDSVLTTVRQGTGVVVHRLAATVLRDSFSLVKPAVGATVSGSGCAQSKRRGLLSNEICGGWSFTNADQPPPPPVLDTVRTDTTSAPAPPSGTNEPAGMVPFAHHTMTGLNEDGVTEYYGNPTVPFTESGRGVNRVQNAAGPYTGYGGIYAGKIAPAGKTRLYMRLVFKPQALWRAHYNGYKMFYPVWTYDGAGSGAGSILEMDGSGTAGALHFRFLPQSSIGSQSLYSNMSGSGILRDQYNTLEMFVQINTPGQLNGVVRWWVNGTQEGEYTNLGLASSTQLNPRWFEPRLLPYAGGGVDPVDLTAPQYLYFDDYYISIG